jgi:N utilization substance protein B
LLVKALYQRQLAGHERDELIEQFSRTPEFAHADRVYFEELLTAVLRDTDALDEVIRRRAARGLDQLDAVGRAVLWLALAELGHRPDVPSKVIINEAVELAKRYGPAECFRFVNAVLDDAARSIRANADARGD